MKNKSVDVLLVGAGIMSATLGALIKEVAPEWNITIVEKLGSAGLESSDPWNNAGTGHSALCELNYSVEQKDGSMDVTKAIKINDRGVLCAHGQSQLTSHQRKSISMEG